MTAGLPRTFWVVGKGGGCLAYFLIVLLLGRVVVSQVPIREDPACFYSMIELVCSEGYHVQEHTVVTEDGYILSVYRIPGEKRRPKIPKKKGHYRHIHVGYHPDFADCVNESLNVTTTGHPVLLSHGLIAASDSWVLQGPKSDLAYILADSGYDVWFTNIRGNFYGRRHKTLKPSQLKFWDFSFHENGLYDMAGTIDYILNVTKAPKLTYVGHSMGTTMFFVLASSKPEYNEKIQAFVGLTPVSYLKRENLSFNRKGILYISLAFVKAHFRNGVHEFLPRSQLASATTQIICAKGSPFQDMCYDFGFAILGYHSKLFLRDKLTVYISHSFSGSSVKTFYHYEQLLDSPVFRWYDHGPEENFQRYGREEPPEYDLRKVTVPVGLFYSTGDAIVDVKDVAMLQNSLPNVIESRVYPKLSHVDFIWAYNAKDLIYGKVLELIDRFRNR